MTLPTRTGTRWPGLAVTVVLMAALAALGLVQWAGQPRAAFRGASFAELERAMQASGLQVCAEEQHPDGLAPQAVESRTYQLAVRCPYDPATAVVDRFTSVADRDAAAARFESLVRPRGSGVVYTLGDSTVFLQGSGDQDVREQLGRALTSAGAR